VTDNVPVGSIMQRKRDELLARGIDPARLPPGQYVTDRFPVLHLGPVPEYPTLAGWTLSVDGDGLDAPRTLTWDELRALPVTELTTDIHCVTKWSKLGITWTGVDLADVLGPSRPNVTATALRAWGEHDYSASTTLAELRSRDALVAWAVNGADLTPDHGYPLRLVIPHLYFWKSVKWLRRIEVTSEERPGFWEQHGYHRRGHPDAEERYWGDDLAAPAGSELPRARSGHALGRPLRSLLERALTVSTGSIAADIITLREPCHAALRRCLGLADDGWSATIDCAAAKASWDEWRRGGLAAAADPQLDRAPEATRDLLAELAEELMVRGDVLPGPWEGAQRQGLTDSDEWQAGHRRRQLIFMIERLGDLVLNDDADGLQALADAIANADDTGELTDAPGALRAFAADLALDATITDGARQRLIAAFAGTPFAATAARVNETSSTSHIPPSPGDGA
jgi:DMSO/TMAO reductase YedYZ molybdopterin-dependent catalytic subunit